MSEESKDQKTPEAKSPDPSAAGKADAEKKKPTPKKKKEPAEELPPLVVSSSPHIRAAESIESAMYTVVGALVPAAAMAVVFFGLDALRVMVVSVLACLVFEALCLKLRKVEHFRQTLTDGSAIVTGLLLAMNLPSNAPWWLILAGALVAMVLGKHVFGGLGANPFNPALVARVFLLIAWPAQMTVWPRTRFFIESHMGAVIHRYEGATAATPLGMLKTEGLSRMVAAAPPNPIESLQYQLPLTFDAFVGNVGGCLGETSALFLLLGGVILLSRRVIRWHIPVSYIGSFFVLSAIAWFVAPEKMANPFFHIFAGGLFLGAFFMATDYSTSPLAPKGMLVFGIGCGVLTFVIRYFGSFPEGVSFAIVVMNAFVPLIDRYFTPKRVGLNEAKLAVKRAAAAS